MKKILGRRSRLENKIRVEMDREFPCINKLMTAVEDFECDNIATINKLKRSKAIEVRRINGALKQTINAHGPITKPLIGSASKRVYGSLLSEALERNEKISLRGFFLGILTALTLSMIFNLII
jgi:hypothetical protein